MTDQPPPPGPPPVDAGTPRHRDGAHRQQGWGSPPPGWGSPPPGWGQPPAWGAPQPGWNPGFMPSQVGSGRFRSMSVGEWLDATFTLYRRNFALIASISAVVQIPYALLTWLLFELTGVATFVRSPFASLGAQTHHPGTGAAAPQLLSRRPRRDPGPGAAQPADRRPARGGGDDAGRERPVPRPSQLAALRLPRGLGTPRRADRDDLILILVYAGSLARGDPARRCCSPPPVPAGWEPCSP